MKSLVTGGAGFIGSHTCIELLNSNNEIVVVDMKNFGRNENLNHLDDVPDLEMNPYTEKKDNLKAARSITLH